ncbi:MAG: thiamine phosphate synthase [Bacteroidaceae bacterium]|nr:thiamine phosphate synthase [Bacteroidaceae bacterium]
MYKEDLSMQLIAITYPEFLPQEGSLLTALLAEGLPFLHLRKPRGTIRKVEKLLEEIPTQYYSRIAIHNHLDLAVSHNLGGVHLNATHPLPPVNYKGRISCSCHSLQELPEAKKRCDYLFLSPVYDSISKKGYQSGFSEKELQKASDEGLIDAQVIALGGITSSKLEALSTLHFGGVAILGDLWKEPTIEYVLDTLKKYI